MSDCPASDDGRHHTCSRGWCMDCEMFPSADEASYEFGREDCRQ